MRNALEKNCVNPLTVNLTKWSASQNGQTDSNNLSAKADEFSF